MVGEINDCIYIIKKKKPPSKVTVHKSTYYYLSEQCKDGVALPQ